MDNLEDEDSTSKNCNMIIIYKYHMDGQDHPSGLNPSKYFCEDIEFHAEHTQIDLYGSQLKTVQQKFCNLYCERKNEKTKKIQREILWLYWIV